MNSSIVFRTIFLISGRAVMQEFETGVSLEMYLFPLQLWMKPQKVHPIPGLCDPRFPDIFQVPQHEVYRLHRRFTRYENHFQMIRWDRVVT